MILPDYSHSELHKKIPKKITRYFLLITVLILPLLHGCAVAPCPVREKDGKAYGWPGGNFMGQWDDYYACGISYIEEEDFYDDALWSLEEAIKRRHRDQRKARSYGLHFVDDYFPHREKAWIHYKMDKYEQALSELDISIEHEPSDKAYKIRDKVMIEIMKQDIMKKKLSVKNPDFRLKFPPGKSKASYIMTLDKTGKLYNIWTKDDSVAISGVATDKERYISELVLKGKQIFPNGRQIFLEHSSKEPVEFEEYIRLDQGEYEFDITARNLLYSIYNDPTVEKGETTLHVKVHVDRSGPVIIITKFNPDGEIQGYLYDKSGIRKFLVDEENVSVQKEKKVAFTVPLKPGRKSLSLLVEDKLGNETMAIVNPGSSAFAAYPVILAETNSDIVTDAGKTLTAQFGDIPEIILKGWPDQETVYLRRVNIQGQILSSNIDKLTINDIPVLPHMPGHKIIFNHSVDLKPGENTIKIETQNSFGANVKEIIITRKIPRAYQLKYRYCLAIYPFVYSNQENERNNFQHVLLKNFAEQQRFQMILRKNPEDTVDVSCHSTLFGVINETKDGFEAIARVVDIETSRILTVEDSYCFSKANSDIELTVERLVEKIHRRFPLAQGIIKKFRWWSTSFIPEFENVNKYDTEIWPMIVFRNQEPMYNPATGESLGCDTIIVGYECINGKCKKKSDNQKIGKGDKVVMQ